MTQRAKYKKRVSLLGYLLGSKVAFFLIVLNLSTFVFAHFSSHKEMVPTLILSPWNLMEGRYYTLITSGFLHRDLSHLLLNMLGVFVFARVVEQRFGFMKTLFLYLGALILSMFFSVLIYVLFFNRNVAIIGASGAVMGLIACAMLISPFCITYEMILPIPVMIKGWMFFYADLRGFLGGENDGVSHLAHLLGFLSIAVLVYFLGKTEKKIMKTGLVVNVISFCVFLFLRHWYLNYF